MKILHTMKESEAFQAENYRGVEIFDRLLKQGTAWLSQAKPKINKFEKFIGTVSSIRILRRSCAELDGYSYENKLQIPQNPSVILTLICGYNETFTKAEHQSNHGDFSKKVVKAFKKFSVTVNDTSHVYDTTGFILRVVLP